LFKGRKKGLGRRRRRGNWKKGMGAREEARAGGE